MIFLNSRGLTRCLYMAALLPICACSHHPATAKGKQPSTSATPVQYKGVVLKPEDVPTLYSGLPPTDQRCSQIALEISKIDTGLGAQAIEAGPKAPPTATDRLSSFGKNLAVESIKGVVQPVIQTKRAIMNDDAKDQRAAEALARGNVRRAYLKGLQDGIPCSSPAVATGTP